jgi:hypothetical protein
LWVLCGIIFFFFFQCLFFLQFIFFFFFSQNLFFLISYRDDCGTLAAAHGAEAMHQLTKMCFFNTGKSCTEKTARYTSVQQAHLAILNSMLNSFDNDVKYYYELSKEKLRHTKTLKVGREAVERAFHYISMFEKCKDENTNVIITESTDGDGRVIFHSEETMNSCAFHRDFNRYWEWRGTTAEVKEYKKIRDTECACVTFHRIEDDGIITEDNSHINYWCQFNDEPVQNNAMDGFGDEANE